MDAFTNALLTFQNPLLDVMLVVAVISQLLLFLPCEGGRSGRLSHSQAIPLPSLVPSSQVRGFGRESEFQCGGRRTRLASVAYLSFRLVRPPVKMPAVVSAAAAAAAIY